MRKNWPVPIGQQYDLSWNGFHLVLRHAVINVEIPVEISIGVALNWGFGVLVLVTFRQREVDTNVLSLDDSFVIDDVLCAAILAFFNFFFFSTEDFNDDGCCIPVIMYATSFLICQRDRNTQY